MKKNRKRKIINRNIVMLVIVFVAVMATLIHSYAEESNVSQEEIESSDTIHNVNYSYTSDNEKYYQAFEYQDEMLAADSGTLSPDLAKVTVGLATAAYAESEIKACLSSMNYTLVDSKTFNYDGERKATYEDNDFVAFSIGHKKVSLNGEIYNAYVVPIRGTTGNDEWLSNFKLGAAGDSYHYGFKKAADGVLSTLRSKIKTKNNIFLITGHSRGAAVANIVAGELTIDKDLASPNHIFGYTYACPAVKIGADTTLDNVININNPGDAIPELPLADWGYQRYGKSLSLSTDKKFYDNMKVQYKNALGREYAGILNTDSYVATLKTIAGIRDAYFQPENQMLFELAGWLLGPKTEEMDTLAKILAHYNVNGLIGKSISNILSDITVSGVQTAFDKENQNNKEILITIDGYLEDTVNMNESEFEDWRKSISNTSTFEKLQDEMNITIRTRSDLVQLRKEVKEEMDSFSYTQSNLETILSLFYTTKGELKNAIFDGHTPLTYVKWINSTYYGCYGWKNNDDVKNMEIENNIKRIDISCFQECQNLNQVILPDTLEHVRESAFSGCTGIKELTIPVDLDYEKMSNPSFNNCENIEKIIYSKGKTGIMPDIDNGGTSYHTAEYYAGKKLTMVEFEEGVKNIGAGAYYRYWQTGWQTDVRVLKNIKLASTVKKIGDYAFYKNEAITEFDFSNIKELGKHSFSGCSGLSDLTIPSRLKEIPDSCFSGCTGLSSLKIPVTIDKVGESAFKGCTGIEGLIMPVDLDYVKKYSSPYGCPSFDNCKNIEKIIYTKGKTGIMPDRDETLYWTVEYCVGENLTTIEFEEGVKNIGARAYYSHTSGDEGGLKNIKLASTVKKIGDYAFLDDKSITDFDFSNIEELGEGSFYGCSGLSNLSISEDLKEIPESCFFGCKGLRVLKIPETIETVCENAFRYCSGIKELTLPVDLDYVKTDSSEMGYSSFSGCENIEKIIYTKGKTGIMSDSDRISFCTAEYCAGENLTTIEFEEGVKNIGARAYYWHAGAGGSRLKNIKLASTIKKIGDYAFYENTAITDFDFSNIEELGEGSFYGCSGLLNLEISRKLKEIPTICFSRCTGINILKIPENIEKVCDNAFSLCTGIKELTMPVDLDYVKTYSSGSFTDCASFKKCENIEKITYTKGKTGIMSDIEDDRASYYTAEYYAGKNLTTVEFGEGVKNIGARAYKKYLSIKGNDYGMPNLKNVKLAATVKKIGDYAFYNNKAITDFDFSNIEELGERSFSGCSGLSDLTIPAGVKEIPVSCFYGCTGLSSLKIPETIEKVCGSAFSGCTGIKELTMPVDLDYVKTYSSSSFIDCENIEKITYSKGKTGIMPDIESESIWYNTAEYYAGKNLTTVEFEEGVKNIGARAYRMYRDSTKSCGYDYGMPNLKNIKLAATVKKIGDDAFYKDKAITEFDFSNIEKLGERSFSGCSGLSDLTIPAELKEIPDSCFYGCTGLSSLKIPETIEKVCKSAFKDCTGIKELTMPVDLDYVKTSYPSFNNCGNIEKITYSKGKTGIMPDMKSGSTSYYTAEYYAGKKLTTVEFQSGIEYIGAGSFDQASALKNIVLPCTVSAISSKTFCAINKSKAVIYGTKDTYAEAYAKEQKIPFRGWNDPIITPEEPVAAPEEQVQLMGIAYTGVDEYVNISDWSVKECESKDTHIDENGLLTVGKDEPKGEIVVAACYGNYTETVKVRIVNPTYIVHFVGDITLDAKTDENCNVYCPREYEEKGYEYQYYLGKDTDSEQLEEKDWPLTVAQDTEIYVKRMLKEPSIDKINPTEKEMDFIYDGEKREISISASHEIGEKGVLSYQWYYDEMQDGDFEEIHLATGASISVKDVKDSGVYKCRVTLCDGMDTTWVDSKMVRVNITQRLVAIPILQDSQKNLYYTGVEQKLLFEKLETDWLNITEAAATFPGNYVASVGLKDAENSIWADGTKEAKEYPWKIIGKETTLKPLESPTVTNAPTYEPGNTARPSGAPDENPSKTPEIKPGEVPTESPTATDTPTYEPGNTARPSGAPDENPERTPEIKASEVPTDVPEIKPTIAPDKITTGSQDTDLVFQPEDMTGDSREEALFLEKKVNVKKLQNKKKNKLYISWGKVELPQKAFYQVQISTKRNFKGAKNIYTTKSIYCYKGVKKGKKYYVRVRLGVTRDGKKIYGKWSNLKKKKIKN